MAKPEEILHKQVAGYIKKYYPDVIFFSEPSGLRLQSWHQKKLLKAIRSVGKLPDIFIALPVEGYNKENVFVKFHGFFLELKVAGTTIYKKNGEVVADEHIQAQLEMLKRLYALGYAATFGIGLEPSVKLIEDYFSIPKRKQKIIPPAPTNIPKAQ
jgi:hypothetical protein